MGFLRRHWVWIAAPVVVIVLAIVVVLWLGQEPEVAPFDYTGR